MDNRIFSVTGSEFPSQHPRTATLSVTNSGGWPVIRIGTHEGRIYIPQDQFNKLVLDYLAAFLSGLPAPEEKP